MCRGEQLFHKQPLHIHRFYTYYISYKTKKYETKLSISYPLIGLLPSPIRPTITPIAAQYIPNRKINQHTISLRNATGNLLFVPKHSQLAFICEETRAPSPDTTNQTPDYPKTKTPSGNFSLTTV